VQVLEAQIHAVETEALSLARVEDALERNRRAKERFIKEFRPPTAAQLRGLIGSESHQRVADDMSAFA